MTVKFRRDNAFVGGFDPDQSPRRNIDNDMIMVISLKLPKLRNAGSVVIYHEGFVCDVI